MSRIIVKNIPKYVDNERLRTHFGKYGDITDVKIVTKDGKNRKFCFIGFKDSSAGQKAKDYFNNTFIDTSRIVVDLAKMADDPDLPRAWSRYSKGSSAYNQKHGIEQPKKQKDPSEEEAEKTQMKEEKRRKFLEFLNVMKGTNQSWNDDVARMKPKEEEEKVEEEKPKKNGKGKEKKKEEEKKDNKMEIEEQKVDKNQPLTSLPVDTKRLFVLNLPHSITDAEFQEVFEKYGQIVETKLPKDNTGKRKGYGYVTFLTEEAAISAFAELDNKVVLGRIMHIKPAYAPKKLLYQQPEEKEQQERQERNERPEKEKSSYKKQRKADLLKRLDDDTNWNTLFLNPNTILAEMSQRLNIKKSDILGQESENSAVKVALAETQIINETKEWLEANGLNLEAFKSDRKTCARSTTTIIVKNLPYSVTVEELYSLFNNYGAVYKVHLPPTKSVAVIEFVASDQAQNAFKQLAYYELNQEPLYLEWAPVGLVDEKQKEINEEREEMMDAKSRTLFVKNLNFDTTEETIKEVFGKEKLGKFTIKIVKKANKLSCGYGFIEFELQENAQKALKKLQHKIIDGHAIQLSISNPVKEEPKKTNKRKHQQIDNEATPKIIVRNVAFEATSKEIRDLFKTFGEVKTVRMPKKINGQHRGFAFVEFVSVEEATNAFNSLNHTHLYGRKLNLEFSTAEDNMEEITKKVKMN